MRTKVWSAFTVLLIAMLACGLPSPAAPEALPPPATLELAPQPLPVATTGPALSAFRDDFEGALAAGWQWSGEDPTRWNLTSTPGHLRIVAQDSNIDDGSPRNFLLREAPQGNFEIATSVRFTPTSHFQLAGLLVYQEQGSALQFGPANAPCPGGSEGQCVYLDTYQGGNFFEPNFGTYTGGGSPAFLRLRRVGSSYTAYYSADGTNWQEIGSQQTTITPRYVGLIAAQGYQGEVPADFDYFTLEQLP